ncbi:MAG: 3-phosphoglycerate dehydrogenase [Vicingaceae bacterium]|nr:MAG: 3-phosphoglycerate dehydrogenase [Vicingaceae bacterium]
MINILANDGIDDSAKTLLENKGFNVIDQKIEQNLLSEFINQNNIEVIIVRSATQVRKDLIDKCNGLKIIARAGVGTDNIDVEYAKSKGIAVFNTPAASSQSVAELVFAHIFALYRFLHQSNREMPVYGHEKFSELKKKYSKGREIKGKTIGIIGLGRIGTCVAEYAIRLGMNVLAYDPYVTKRDLVFQIAGQKITATINSVTLDEVLLHSDIVTLHVPKTSDGKPLLGENELTRLKPHAIIVNASRGGIIDEQALINAVKNKQLMAAGLDVFVNEPKPNKEILQINEFSLTPHTGASTIEAQERIGVELAEQIIAFYQA